MTALLHRRIMRPKTTLPDFTGVVQSFLRRLSLPKGPAGEASLQLLESVSLGAEASIALIRFEREALVLGVTPQSVTLLVRREAPVVSCEMPAKTHTPLP